MSQLKNYFRDITSSLRDDGEDDPGLTKRVARRYLDLAQKSRGMISRANLRCAISGTPHLKAFRGQNELVIASGMDESKE
jgi:hypothetical protein